MTALPERRRIFCVIFRSRSVDEQQSRNSILTEWIGMGRSGSQTSAKRQLWDCVTLTMVVLSLLFRPGKSCFQSVPAPLLHAALDPAPRRGGGDGKIGTFPNFSFCAWTQTLNYYQLLYLLALIDFRVFSVYKGRNFDWFVVRGPRPLQGQSIVTYR